MAPSFTLLRSLLAAVVLLLPLVGRAQSDLTVSNSQTNPGGTYNNVTITGTGILSLQGSMTVNGTLTIRAGGRLSPNCFDLMGPGNFDLQGNGSLDICSVDGIAATGPIGSVQMTGTRTFSNDANYIYSGTLGPQVTGNGMPTTVRSLQNFNTDGLTMTTDLALGSDVNVRQVLRANGGSINTNGRTIRLMSNASGTAMIINASGGTIIGNVTAERYITPNLNAGAGYRHYSSPLAGQTLNNLITTGFAPIFNPAYDTAAAPGLIVPFPTVYAYDESRVGVVNSVPTGFDQGWRSGQASEAMSAGKGFTVHIGAASKVEFTGVPNNGNYNVTDLNRGAAATSGWHLIGNPYPSPMDWSALVSRGGNTNVGDALYVFESNGTYAGNYRVSINGMGTTPIIGLGQGFFVRSTGNGGQVSFSNVDRIQIFDPADGTFHRPATDTRPALHLTLANAAATLADETIIYTETGATTGFDARFDASKLNNLSGLNLATQLGAERYSVNGLPAFGPTTMLLPLTVGVPAAGNFSLTVSSLVNLPAGTQAYLRDVLTGTRTLLSTGSSYAFATTTTTANGRFVIEIQPAGTALATAAQTLAAQVQLYPNPAAGHFTVQLPATAQAVPAELTNALGQVVLRRSLSANATDIDVSSLRAGVYNLHLNLAGTQLVRRVVVE